MNYEKLGKGFLIIGFALLTCANLKQSLDMSKTDKSTVPMNGSDKPFDTEVSRLVNEIGREGNHLRHRNNFIRS